MLGNAGQKPLFQRLEQGIYSHSHDTPTNVGLMLDQRLRRWPNIEPTLGRCIVFTGNMGGDGSLRL